MKAESCSGTDQEWVLGYLLSSKRTVPYEMINRLGSPDLASEKEFFSIEQFHSKLKANMISEEEYEAVKKLYLTMKMENLSEFNKLYNFQDAITLCKMFESRASFLSEKFKFNARK